MLPLFFTPRPHKWGTKLSLRSSAGALNLWVNWLRNVDLAKVLILFFFFFSFAICKCCYQILRLNRAGKASSEVRYGNAFFILKIRGDNRKFLLVLQNVSISLRP